MPEEKPMPPESPNIPIAGMHPVTAINYPGKIAACIFTQGCNLRCPYCHNQELLPIKPGKVSLEETMAFLRRSKKLIEGVVITGGEPTIHPDLPQVIAGIKKEGLMVKLDTNGTNPDMLQCLIEEKLIDAVSMDIKTTPDKYGMLGVDMATILRSISLIGHSGVEYEFRTTVDGQICTDEDVAEIEKLTYQRPENTGFRKPFENKNIFAIVGILASLVWFLVSKRKLYWQTYWEQRLFDFEREHLPGLDFFGASQQRIQNDVEKNLILHKEMGWLQAIVYKLVLKRPSINNSMLCVPALFVLGWVGLLFSSVKPLM